jgi:hypothetical protein
MRASVANSFIQHSLTHEGWVRWPYLDRLGYVTVGLGNLLEDTATGQPLPDLFAQPWKHLDGSRASQAEVLAGFNAVKARQDLKGIGGGNAAFEQLTDLRLSDEDIGNFVKAKLAQFEISLRNQFPFYENWPADGQWALLSSSWAKGPDFTGWPHLRVALNAPTPDFETASREIHISNATPERNEMNRQLMVNAAAVQAGGGDFDRLYFPGTFQNPASTLTEPSTLLASSQPGSSSSTASSSLARLSLSTNAKITLASLGGLALAALLYFTTKKGRRK